jgi:hypothetical protein
MKIVRALRLGIALGVVLALACACAASPDRDFWGNPINKPGAPSCTVPTAAPPGSDVGDGLGPEDYKNRPPGIASGNSWIMIGVHIRALDPTVPGVGIDYCAPVDIVVTVDALDEDTLIDGREGERVYEFSSVTPWLNHFVPFDYDPTDPRFAGRPPRYAVKVEAYYVPGILDDVSAPQLITCELTIWTGVVASTRTAPAAGPAYCSLVNNRYDRYDQYDRP